MLGVNPQKIKNERDLEPVRYRCKRKYKELMQMKPQKKFEAKKILEAFEMIKKNLRNPEGLGQFLGRSRKERELDKHFNHQTKEIKAEIKNKKKSRAERL